MQIQPINTNTPTPASVKPPVDVAKIKAATNKAKVGAADELTEAKSGAAGQAVKNSPEEQAEHSQGLA